MKVEKDEKRIRKVLTTYKGAMIRRRRKSTVNRLRNQIRCVFNSAYEGEGPGENKGSGIRTLREEKKQTEKGLKGGKVKEGQDEKQR
jgi:hypothetical protein